MNLPRIPILFTSNAFSVMDIGLSMQRDGDRSETKIAQSLSIKSFPPLGETAGSCDTVILWSERKA